MATKAPSSDLRTHLQTNYPRLSSWLPDGFVKPANVAFMGWRRMGYARYLVAAAFMASLPWVMKQGWLGILEGNFGITVLFVTGYWILLTLGLSVVVGLAGLLDLGYIAFFMLGAYVTALMTESASPFHFVQWPTWASIPFAVIVAMLGAEWVLRRRWGMR